MANPLKSSTLAASALTSLVAFHATASTPHSQESCTPADLKSQLHKLITEGSSEIHSQEQFLEVVKTRLSSTCDGILTQTDIQGILDAAEAVQTSGPAGDTRNLKSASHSLADYITLGLQYVLYDSCKSDLGTESSKAVKQCVCTSIVNNNATGFNLYPDLEWKLIASCSK